MALLLADEDFAHPVIEELRVLGHDVVTMEDAGCANQGTTDAAMLALAKAGGRAVITFNRRHFIRLHRQQPVHYGVLVCTRDPNSAALAIRIHQAIAGLSDLSNQLIRIYRPDGEG